LQWCPELVHQIRVSMAVQQLKILLDSWIAIRAIVTEANLSLMIYLTPLSMMMFQLKIALDLQVAIHAIVAWAHLPLMVCLLRLSMTMKQLKMALDLLIANHATVTWANLAHLGDNMNSPAMCVVPWLLLLAALAHPIQHVSSLVQMKDP